MLMENFLQPIKHLKVVEFRIEELVNCVVLTNILKIKLEARELKDLKITKYLF